MFVFLASDRFENAAHLSHMQPKRNHLHRWSRDLLNACLDVFITRFWHIRKGPGVSILMSDSNRPELHD